MFDIRRFIMEHPERYSGENAEDNVVEDQYFLWGIKAKDDQSHHLVADLRTMNDIDIIWDGVRSEFYLDIECIYGFNDKESMFRYVEMLFERFDSYCRTLDDFDWNAANNIRYDDFFDEGVKLSAPTLEQVYSNFRILYRGYMTLAG